MNKYMNKFDSPDERDKFIDQYKLTNLQPSKEELDDLKNPVST